jgi:mono/diheme cytochrome c family protein
MERWLALSSLVLTLVMGWVVWDAYHTEWEGYQKNYFKLALLRARGETQKEWAKGQRLEIRQLQPKELGMVERCGTCHLALDNPTLGSLPEPFGTHSSLLQSHPPERFGCVVCHGGEGRAVTTLEAHGQGEIIAKPLLKGDYMQAACYECHGETTLPPKATAAVVRGRQLINRYLCLGCHRINGAGGDEGPDLSIVGSHRNWLWLYAHLARPQGVVVGSTMPVFSLSREEIKDITVYLMTLLDTRDRSKKMPLRAKKVVTSYDPDRPQEQNGEERLETPIDEAIGRFQYDGESLFRGAGCSLCHMIGSKGGEVGPPLTYIARKRKPEDLKRLLSEPEELLPGGKMPQLYLNEEQIKALVGYLGALR